jgi:hypothetical protein
MKEKFLPWFLLFCALGLSGTAAYYSVVGLSVVFVGVALPVIIMGSFLEISKIAIATYLHDKWKETYGVLKIYLTIALVTLSLITSLGIYGLLSTGFQGNIAKLEINQKKIANVEVKKTRFIEIKNEQQKEKDVLDKDISKLRDGLSNNTTTQSVDKKTGQLITKANNANRKSFEDQLKLTTENRDKVSTRIDAMNDSITKLDIEILNMESAELEGSELGSIKYISEISTRSNMKYCKISDDGAEALAAALEGDEIVKSIVLANARITFRGFVFYSFSFLFIFYFYEILYIYIYVCTFLLQAYTSLVPYCQPLRI